MAEILTFCLGSFFAGWIGGYTLRQIRRFMETV